MGLFVVDTDILSLFQTGHSQVSQRILQHPANDLAVTIITVEEQLSGWYTLRRRVKSRSEVARVYERLTENVRFLSRIQLLSFSESAIDRYEQLTKSKLGVRGNDLRIAAIAMDNAATVVTRNLADFGRIPNLNIEDWSV